ncbi:uncharacterized protein LOC125512978 [Triticum urartu]|nr:uncharacterized protein LOC125512978 [Triticum urartu]
MMIGSHIDGGQKVNQLSLAYAQKLWNEWELQCMVLGSFALQAFLLFAAHIRKRNTSTMLRILLWLAYLMADYVAVFVLGHLTLQTNDPRHQLVLLWAPVLLLHLGGQDTITALSMEDNEVWKRHLLGLVTQVVLAVYVVAKSWRDKRLLAPVVLMFVSGTVKYAERTWALKMATAEAIKDSRMGDLYKALRKFEDPKARQAPQTSSEIAKYNQEIVGRNKWWLQQEYADLVQAPGDSLPNCINVLNDIPVAPWVLPSIFNMIEEIYRRDNGGSTQAGGGGKDWFSSRAYKLCELQLSLIYDRLYTKVGLRYNQSRPIISIGLQLLTLGTTSTALVLFATARKQGSVYSRVDIVVSYILLAGAVALELLSMLMVTLSYRSYCFLRDRFGVNRFTRMIFCVIRFVRPYHKPLWSNKWAQYNLIAGCIKEKQAGVVARMMRRIGLAGDSKLCAIPDETKELICNELDDQVRCERFSHDRGTAILSLRGHHARSELYESIDKVDFPRSVLTWHLITDICFFLTGGDAGLANRHMRLCREVSNYLMDLVMVRRVMTSSEGHVAHLKAREEVKLMLEHHSDKKVKVDDVEAVRKMLDAGVSHATAASSGYVPFARNSTDTMRPVLPRAWALAQTLLHPAGRSSGGAQWELIASVLMEMLFHLAPRCEAGFHAKNLSAGGEYITHVRFLLHNRGFGWNFVLART